MFCTNYCSIPSTSASTSATNTTTNEGSCKLHITRIRNTIFAFNPGNNVKIKGNFKVLEAAGTITINSVDRTESTNVYGQTLLVMDANQPVWIDDKNLSNEPESNPIEFRKSLYQCGDKMIADAYPYDEMIISQAGNISHYHDFYIWNKALNVKIQYGKELTPAELKDRNEVRQQQAQERAKEKEQRELQRERQREQQRQQREQQRQQRERQRQQRERQREQRELQRERQREQRERQREQREQQREQREQQRERQRQLKSRGWI